MLIFWQRNMKLLFSLIFLPYILFANDVSRIDNFAVFNQVAEQVVRQICNRVDGRHYESIIIESLDSNNNSDWLIEKWFIEAFQADGIDSVFLLKNMPLKKDDTPVHHRSSLKVAFKTIACQIDYQNVNSFWKIKSTERRIIIELWIKMQNMADGALVWEGNVREIHTDQIDYNNIPEFENKNIIFTMAPVPSAPNLKRIIEPILIVGLSGGIMYLFYAFRSK